jgi:cell division protein FtsW
VNPTDLFLFGLIIALVVFGLNILLASSSFMAREQFSDPYFFLKKQAFAAFIGFLGMVAMTQIDLENFRHWVWPLYAVTLVLLVLVFVPGIGRRAGGANRWIAIAGFPFNHLILRKSPSFWCWRASIRRHKPSTCA